MPIEDDFSDWRQVMNIQIVMFGNGLSHRPSRWKWTPVWLILWLHISGWGCFMTYTHIPFIFLLRMAAIHREYKLLKNPLQKSIEKLDVAKCVVSRRVFQPILDALWNVCRVHSAFIITMLSIWLTIYKLHVIDTNNLPSPRNRHFIDIPSEINLKDRAHLSTFKFFVWINCHVLLS